MADTVLIIMSNCWSRLLTSCSSCSNSNLYLYQASCEQFVVFYLFFCSNIPYISGSQMLKIPTHLIAHIPAVNKSDMFTYLIYKYILSKTFFKMHGWWTSWFSDIIRRSISYAIGDSRLLKIPAVRLMHHICRRQGSEVQLTCRVLLPARSPLSAVTLPLCLVSLGQTFLNILFRMLPVFWV